MSSPQAEGVPRAVPALVVRARDLSAVRSSGEDEPASRSAPIVVWRASRLLLGGEGAGLVEDLVGHADLAHVVQQARLLDALGLGLAQAGRPRERCRTAGSCA